MITIYTVGSHNTVLNAVETTKTLRAAVTEVLTNHNRGREDVQMFSENLAYIQIGEDLMKVVLNEHSKEGEEFVSNLVF